MGDWCDSDDAEDDTAAREWRSLERHFMTMGFREGASVGQEGALQGGFNEGFRSGLEEGLPNGLLQGIIRCAARLKRQRATASERRTP